MFQNPWKTLEFKKKMVFKIPNVQPVAYLDSDSVPERIICKLLFLTSTGDKSMHNIQYAKS